MILHLEQRNVTSYNHNYIESYNPVWVRNSHHHQNHIRYCPSCVINRDATRVFIVVSHSCSCLNKRFNCEVATIAQYVMQSPPSASHVIFSPDFLGSKNFTSLICSLDKLYYTAFFCILKCFKSGAMRHTELFFCMEIAGF